MKPGEYGEDYSAHLLEQYKLYVEMADRVSQRRDQSNRFYVTMFAALVGLLVVMARFDGLSSDIWPIVFMIAGLFGAAVSVVWFVNIQSYRSLNTAKFEVINDIEELLPYAGYSKEWERLRPADDSPRYFQLTRVEQFVPIVFFTLFIALVGYSIYLLTPSLAALILAPTLGPTPTPCFR